MSLHKKGKWWYGDDQSDIRDELVRYGKLNGYEPTQFADGVCHCGASAFQLTLDGDEGAAVRTCEQCQDEHLIGDSEEYLQNANLEECDCHRGEAIFEITAGVSLYDNSEDVRWIYIGCRCVLCGLTGCHGDWKNEFMDYKKLLAKI